MPNKASEFQGNAYQHEESQSHPNRQGGIGEAERTGKCDATEIRNRRLK